QYQPGKPLGWAHPITTSGPYAPAPGQITAWEDPSTFIPIMASNAAQLGSNQRLNNYRQDIHHNIHTLEFSLPLVLMIFGLIGVLDIKRPTRLKLILGSLAATSLL